MMNQSSIKPNAFRHVQAKLKSDYQTMRNWDKVGGAHGISSAMAWKIVNEDYIPKTARIRAILGLEHQITIDVNRDAKGRFTKR